MDDRKGIDADIVPISFGIGRHHQANRLRRYDNSQSIYRGANMKKSLILSLSLAMLMPQIRAEPTAASPSPATYPTKFETVPSDEAAQIAETIDLTLKLEEKRYADRLARRGVHPKAHGCVQAKFTVNPDIPEEYKVGVLAQPGKTYDAWIRFSNATALVTPDALNGIDPTTRKPIKEANSRGMAIKLMGVEGSTLLGEPGAKTQDFLLINQPMFAFPNVHEYLEVTKVQYENNEDLTKYFSVSPPLPQRFKTLSIVRQIKATKLANPLETAYFSASPFLFGKDKVAKFSVLPRDATQSPMPADLSDNYLREALKKSLDVTEGKPAVFDFRVQIRKDDSLPIEDASAEWIGGDAAKFQNVATITIDKQNFDEPLRETECEHLVFTPWHGLVDFQPLGGINRLRLGVYNASAKFRAQTREPSGFPPIVPPK